MEVESLLTGGGGRGSYSADATMVHTPSCQIRISRTVRAPMAYYSGTRHPVNSTSTTHTTPQTKRIRQSQSHLVFRQVDSVLPSLHLYPFSSSLQRLFLMHSTRVQTHMWIMTTVGSRSLGDHLVYGNEPTSQSTNEDRGNHDP